MVDLVFWLTGFEHFLENGKLLVENVLLLGQEIKGLDVLFLSFVNYVGDEFNLVFVGRFLFDSSDGVIQLFHFGVNAFFLDFQIKLSLVHLRIKRETLKFFGGFLSKFEEGLQRGKGLDFALDVLEDISELLDVHD